MLVHSFLIPPSAPSMDLYDILVFRLFADWAWGGEPSDDVSPEICLDSIPFLSRACFAGLLVKGVGIMIILGACLNKAPIIRNIIKTHSVAGLSTGAVYGEVIMYSNAAFYGVLRGNPFTAYGENAAITIQTLATILLIWKYRNPTVPFSQKIAAAAVFLVYIFVSFSVLTPEQYPFLLTANLPVLIYSRGLQIMETFRVKHTGSNSLVTVGMNLVGSVIRIITTTQEIGWDIAMLRGYFLSATLNIVIVTQFLVFKNNTAKFRESLKAKKAD